MPGGSNDVREGLLLIVTKGSTRQLQQQHREFGRGGSTPMLVANIVRNIFVRNIVRNNLRPVRNICSELDMGQTPNRSKIDKNLSTSPKVNMLKFGDVSFDLGFERGKMSATGYVAKISMLRLNIGSGKLSSCMLSIGRGPKAVQGKGGAAPPCLVRIWVRGQC